MKHFKRFYDIIGNTTLSSLSGGDNDTTSTTNESNSSNSNNNENSNIDNRSTTATNTTTTTTTTTKNQKDITSLPTTPQFKFINVQVSDSVLSISTKYNMKEEDLMILNRLTSRNLYPGQTLIVCFNFISYEKTSRKVAPPQIFNRKDDSLPVAAEISSKEKRLINFFTNGFIDDGGGGTSGGHTTNRLLECVSSHPLLLPRLREKYSISMYSKDINTLDGHIIEDLSSNGTSGNSNNTSLDHGGSRSRSKSISNANLYFDNIMFIQQNIQHQQYYQQQSQQHQYKINVIMGSLKFLSGSIILFNPKSTSQQQNNNKLEILFNNISGWKLSKYDKDSNNLKIAHDHLSVLSSHSMLLCIYLKSYIQDSYKKNFIIINSNSGNGSNSGTGSSSGKQSTSNAPFFEFETLESILRDSFQDIEQIEHESLLPIPTGGPSNWDKILSKPISELLLLSSIAPPVSPIKSSFGFSSVNNLNNNSNSNNNNTVETIPSSPPTKESSGTSVVSPFKSFKTSTDHQEVVKFEIFYLYDDIKRVEGILTILPNWLIFQANANDLLVKKEGSLKFQLNYMMDQVVYCKLIPKSLILASSNDDQLQFNMDDEKDKDKITPTYNTTTTTTVTTTADSTMDEIDDIVFEKLENSSNSLKSSTSAISPSTSPKITITTITSTNNNNNNNNNNVIRKSISSSLGHTGIHIIVLLDNLVEKDIIFECDDQDANTICNLINKSIESNIKKFPTITRQIVYSTSPSPLSTSTSSPLSNNNPTKSNPPTPSFSKLLNFSGLFDLNSTTTPPSHDLDGAIDLSTPGHDNFFNFLTRSKGDGDDSGNEETEDDSELSVDHVPTLYGVEDSPSFINSTDATKLARHLPPTLRLKNWVLLYKTIHHGTSMITLYNKTKDQGPCLLFIKDSKYRIFGGFISDSIHCTKSYYGNGECFVFHLKQLKESEEIELNKLQQKQKITPLIITPAIASIEELFNDKVENEYDGDNNENSSDNNSGSKENKIVENKEKVEHAHEGEEEEGTFICYPWSKKNECFVQTNDHYISMGGGVDGKYAFWVDNELHFGSTSPCITYNSQPLTDGNIENQEFKCVELEIWGFD